MKVNVISKKNLFPTLTLSLLFLLPLLFAGTALNADRKPIKPSPRERCPVCGMFVSKYPDWLASIRFQDGSYAFFDGVKDMMKYYHNLKRYNPSKKISDIESIRVTDYYRLEPIDGLKAFYVIGSNVYGPMGRELIPFEKEEDAMEFMVDHVGKGLLRFKEISHDVLKGLD